MRFIKSIIIVVGVVAIVSCKGRLEEKSSFEDSEPVTVQEPVIGVWKSGKHDWSAMQFMEDGTVQLENSKGESLKANWKRVEGSVYKARIYHELVGAYDRIESSTSVPKPVEGSQWVLKPNAVQYELWSDQALGSEKLPLITVEGDQLQKDGNDPADYYKRINS